jgi:hypothetical protein
LSAARAIKLSILFKYREPLNSDEIVIFRSIYDETEKPELVIMSAKVLVENGVIDSSAAVARVESVVPAESSQLLRESARVAIEEIKSGMRSAPPVR